MKSALPSKPRDERRREPAPWWQAAWRWLNDGGPADALPPRRPAARVIELKPPRRPRRLLIVGETAPGAPAAELLPRLLGERFPGLQVVDACRPGIRMAELLGHVASLVSSGRRFDAVLLRAGAADLDAGTAGWLLQAQAAALLPSVQRLAACNVWLMPTPRPRQPLWDRVRDRLLLHAVGDHAQRIGVRVVRGTPRSAPWLGTGLAARALRPAERAEAETFAALMRIDALQDVLCGRSASAGRPSPHPSPSSQENRHAHRL